MHPLLDRFAWKIAARELRARPFRHLLYGAVVMFGVAALVSVDSFRVNVLEAIDSRARGLLGADLVIESRHAFTAEAEQLIRSIPGTESRQLSFNSMVLFPKNDGTRIAQVRAIDGGFPFYGEFSTAPPEAFAKLHDESDTALIEINLSEQFGVGRGDKIRVGEKEFTIGGFVTAVPGEAPAMGLIGPRVYIPYRHINETKLIQVGSLARYKAMFKLERPELVAGLVERIKQVSAAQGLRLITVESRKQDLGKTVANVSGFLTLCGFVALLLGLLGVASATYVHLREKMLHAAIFRCLGASASQVMCAYTLQSMVLALSGAFLGVCLGIVLQSFLPYVLRDFMPFDVELFVSASAIAKGAVVGLVGATLVSLIALSPLRTSSPLAAIRADFAKSSTRATPPYALLGAGVVFILTFAMLSTGSVVKGGLFSLVLGVVFVLLLATAKLLLRLIRPFIRSSRSFVVRQGLLNLYRPQNQTSVVLVAIGLSLFLIVGVVEIQRLLLKQVQVQQSASQPNMLIFDVQADQLSTARRLLNEQGLEQIEQAPMVSMRLVSIDGKPLDKLREDLDIPRWTLRREYRSSYRSQLNSAEKLVGGNYVGSFDQATNSPIPVSFEEGIAEDLKVQLGSTVVFDVQGVELITRVSSLRHVDWKQVRPNFFVLFPEGPLSSAPMTHILATRVSNPAQSAALQRALVKTLPNVSAIDIELIASTLRKVLDRLAFALRFMAFLTAATGMVVLTISLIMSRFHRQRELALLRCLGASTGQLRSISSIEFIALGFTACLVGLTLAAIAIYLFGRFELELHAAPDLTLYSLCALAVIALTAVIGFSSMAGKRRQTAIQLLSEGR